VVFIAKRLETRPVSSRVSAFPEVFSVADSRSKSTEGRSKPSLVLIRRTVWPQWRTSQTDVTGQDRQTDRQRTDSIGRTVLETVAEKPLVW